MKIDTLVTNMKAWLTPLPAILKVMLDESLAGYLYNRPKPRDAAVFIKYWAMTWMAILKFILVEALFKLGPLGLILALIKNPWIFTLLRVNGLMHRLVRGRTGVFHNAICLTVHTVATGVIDQLRNMLFDPERMVINEDLVPTDIVRAMGLNCYLLEAMGIVLPILTSEGTLKYIDEAENAGMNPDSCSLPKATVGMVIKGHMPKGVAM
ncbi:MAG TPA: 2-hydroxyacyl-CoA dehydratase family protein, partial [Deltaproteobacteria bacterium]|nr:2-hydroxyacyl-CoA dehydratase family protein [Deltaproteobacteria bacterium]